MAMHFSKEDQEKLKKDSSEIYKKRTKDSTKEDVANLDTKGKIRYFFDYYFKFVVVGVVILSVLTAVLTEIFKKRPAEVLYIAIRHDMMENEQIEKFSRVLEDHFKLDKEREKVVVDLCSSDMELQTYIFANTVDVVIMDGENFKRWATADYFVTAEEDSLVSFYKDYEEKYRYRAQHLTAEDRMKQEEEGKAEPVDPFEYNCGLYLTDSEKFKMLSLEMKDPVTAITKGTKHKKRAVEFVKYMMDNEIPMKAFEDVPE